MGTAGGFMAGSIVGKLLLDKMQWNSSVASVAKDEEALKGTAKRIGESFINAGKMLALAGAAVTGSLVAMVKSAANAGDQIHDLSLRTGISAELLSGYKLAADQAGTSIEGLATGLRIMAGRVMDADKGMDEAKRSFDALGISIKDRQGHIKDLNRLLLEAADKFSRMEDGTKKAALAQDLFGRSGTELIPLLNEGASGLQKSYEMAEKLGLVFSTKAAAACDEFNDRLTELGGALKGIKNDIALAVMPVMNKFVNFFTDAMAELRGKIKELSDSGKLQEWAISIGKAFITGFKIATMAVSGLVEAVYFLRGVVFSIGAEVARQIASWGLQIVAAVNAASKVIPGLNGMAKTLAEAWKNVVVIGMEYSEQADKSYEKTTDLVTVFDGLQEILDKASAALDTAGESSGKAAPKINQTGESTKKLKTAISDLVDPIGESTILIKLWKGAVDTAQMSADAFGDAAIDIGRKMDQGGKKAVDAAKSSMSEVSTIMTNFIQDLSRDLVGVIGLDKIFGFKAKDFDDSYFKRALSEAEKFFDDQRKQYDKALDEIRSYYDEIEKASNKRYDDERDLVGEQYDAVLKTARREYEDKRDWIEENVKDEESRKIQLKALDREYEDYVDKLKKEEKDKLKAMEEAHQKDLDVLRAEQKAKEDQLKADLIKLEEDKKLEMDRIRADEDKARDDLAKREEERQGSLWTRLKTTFGKVCEDLLEMWLSNFIKGMISKKATEGLGTAADAITSSIGGAITTLATTLASIGEGIAGAVVAVAQGVATAAGIIAASAKEILIAAGIALAIKSAFDIIGGIIGSIFGGGGGKQTDVTYWLKMIKDNSQILVNFISGNYLDLITRMTSKIESLHDDKFGALLDQQYQQTDFLRQIAEATNATWDIFKGMKFAQKGIDTTIAQPTMIMAGEGGRSERVTVTPNINMNMQPVPINLNINGRTFLRTMARDIYEMSKNRELMFSSNGII